MLSLKEIIQRCHQRHNRQFRQRKTVLTPAIYKGLLYHFTVYCAHRSPIRLYDLEQAEISFMPTGYAAEHDRIPQSFAGERFLKRQKIEDWSIAQIETSWGIQVYTGIPSQRDGAPWHDLEFTYHAICNAPEAVIACIETLVSLVSNPLLTITKSGGLRFSCRVPNYLHPNSDIERYYIYKDVEMPDNHLQRNLFLEIIGEKGHSPWDARFEILMGNLLDPPIIVKEVLIAAIDELRELLHGPQLIPTDKLQPTSEVTTVSLPSLGSYKLDLAKEAFLKRGFSYLRQENDLHYWIQHGEENNNTETILFENDNTIWIRATNNNSGLPLENTSITAIWDDTGILPPIHDTGIQVSDQLLAVREGKLSPLAIKRPEAVLQKPEKINKDYETPADNIEWIQHIIHDENRIIAPINADIGGGNNYAIETQLLKQGKVSLSAHRPIVNGVLKNIERHDPTSVIIWRRHNHLWDKVKDIPTDVRMANPFQHGNMCEDAERCMSLISKGVDPSETICPQCPVYKECQERGYLSQSVTLQRAKTQLIPHSKMFLHPGLSTFVEHILIPGTDSERLCIIDDVRADELFIDCYIDKNTLERWNKDWDGHVLGSFAQALLNTLEVDSGPEDLLVKRIRTIMQAFQHHEVEIIKQMCEVSINCRIVPEKTIDNETDIELSHYTILFDKSVSAYIPIDRIAADRLTAKGLPVLQLETFMPNKETKIRMPIEQAIQLSIFDISTTEKINLLPLTYPNADWTFWHELKSFLLHYTRDADAPILWYDNFLKFWVPPVMHPNVKKLLYMSTTMSEQDLLRTFPDEKIKVMHTKYAPWVEGNQVFQIRTGIYSLKTILDYDSTWDVIGLSKIGKRIVQGICAEIQRDTNIKHAIITYDRIIMQLGDLKEKGNVCLQTDFEYLRNFEEEFEAAQVLWIIGTPFWQPGVMWRRAQILYGNDEKPLCYESDTKFQHYKDPRVQRIHIQAVTGMITEIIGRAGLNRLPDKKVVLISSLQLPNITDRPETLLFDWEDFEVAGNLDKLAETIAKRQKFEIERENLTAESGREKVEQVLGCSSSHANRILQKLRGGNIPSMTFREQILTLLADGEKKVSEVTEAIEGNPKGIHNELVRLTELGEIVKLRWGVYALPDTKNS